MRAVNLLPRDEVRARPQFKLTPDNAPIVVGAGLGVVIVGALALGFMHETGAVSSAQTQLEQKKVELANTPKPPPPTAPKPVDPNAQLSSTQTAMMTAVTDALGARFAWDRVLREFSQVLPDDVWLTSLTFQTPDPTQAAAAAATPGSVPTAITIAGSTYSHDSVARLLARLALIPELNNVTLQSDNTGASSASGGSSASTAPTTGPSIISFTIAAGVNLPAGASALLPAPPPPPPVDTSTDSTGSTS